MLKPHIPSISLFLQNARRDTSVSKQEFGTLFNANIDPSRRKTRICWNEKLPIKHSCQISPQ